MTHEEKNEIKLQLIERLKKETTDIERLDVELQHETDGARVWKFGLTGTFVSKEKREEKKDPVYQCSATFSISDADKKRLKDLLGLELKTSDTERLNPDTDKFNVRMEEILDRTNKKLADMYKINPGDYFIARKPKNVREFPVWYGEMYKYDGIIQKCIKISPFGSIKAENGGWCYSPSWCEKVSPGDVLKTKEGNTFIFKEVKYGMVFDYAYLDSFGYVIISDDKLSGVTYSHATKEEAKPLFDALAKGGKVWNSEKRQIEDKPTPLTYEEVLRGCGCSDEEIGRQKKVDEAYEKTLKELQKASKEYMASVKEAVTELKTGDVCEILVAIADSYAGSPNLGKRDALKQIIKLCKKLLNE